MTTQHTNGSQGTPTKIVTTPTGRIMRINVDEAGVPLPIATPAAPVVKTTVSDPARRADVLFRKRLDEGHEISSWWMVGAFVVTSGLVILLLSGVPGVA
ncbi:MAG: hypothetical protein ACRDVF_02145 [Microbacterium sp.]|uniref:hypothetical protein n=1 Tax=Microbacterium sp. TaxID=51671 RepID=UPI003D6FE4C8